jgi:hypothetical protein
LTRAPFYPAADRTTQWFSTATSPQRATNRLVLWHTTEMGVPGEPWPAYVYNGQRGGSAPHWTVKPNRAERRLMWRQHWRADESARALANKPGGVETNNTGVLQIELGGTSVDGDPGYRWDDPDDWALEGLAEFSVWAYDEWGIPFTDEARQWHALSRNSAGYVIQAGGSTRLTLPGWLAARGHAGHQHAAENDHVDPGAFPADHMLTLARQLATGDDMPLDTADKAWIQAQLHTLVDLVNDVDEKVWTYPIGRSELNAAQTLQNAANGVAVVVAATDTLEQSQAAQSVALADLRVSDEALQAGVDTLNAKLGSGGGGELTKADLLEALGAIRLTTDPATA